MNVCTLSRISTYKYLQEKNTNSKHCSEWHNPQARSRIPSYSTYQHPPRKCWCNMFELARIQRVDDPSPKSSQCFMTIVCTIQLARLSRTSSKMRDNRRSKRNFRSFHGAASQGRRVNQDVADGNRQLSSLSLMITLKKVSSWTQL